MPDNYSDAQGILDELLRGIVQELQLTELMFKRAETAYMAVGEWLAAPGSPLHRVDPCIHAQGSMLLGTTVKPRWYEEFDLDMVLMVPKFPDDPMKLYNIVLARLREHELYRTMVDPMRRCIRLVYANQFHLDVLAARADAFRGGTCIEVPDRKTPTIWQPSNPLGLGRWYEAQALERAAQAAAKAEQAPLPSDVPAWLKTVLQQLTQLLKRARDVAFGRDEEAPRSVVVTVLAGHMYQGEQSPSAALLGVLERICAEVDAARPQRIVVINPTNADEELSERWSEHSEGYRGFDRWVHDLRNKVRRLTELRGLDQVSQALEELFGEKVTKRVVGAYGKRLAEERKAGRVRASVTGLTTGAGRSIPPNTNFGKKR